MAPKMSLKTQVVGFNQYLTNVYGEELRVSTLLLRLGFSAEEVETLRATCLDPFLDDLLTALAAQFAAGQGGARLFDIVFRRYGLDGQEPATLQQLADQYEISRERIRQLEKKAMNRRRNSHQRDILEQNVRDVARTHLAGLGCADHPRMD